MNPLERLQLDLEQCLLSLALINNVSVTRVRPRSAAEAAGIQTKLDKALAGMVERNGKVGVSIIVGMTGLEGVNPNMYALKGDLVVIIDVIENIVINEGVNGTGFTAEEVAHLLARVLPQTNFAPFGQVIATPKLLTPMPEAVLNKTVMYRVTLQALNHCQPHAKVALPDISQAGAVITLTCATSGAAIYHTTDESYPGPGNAAAVLYSAPITLATGTHALRVAAHHAEQASSDVAARTITVA